MDLPEARAGPLPAGAGFGAARGRRGTAPRPLADATHRYAASTWQKQDGFEVGMLKDEWGKLDMPICLSMRGLLAHYEVDG